MSTKLNPNSILNRSITAIKLSDKYVTAPSNSTTNSIAIFNNASGSAIKDSGLTYKTGDNATIKVLSTNTDKEEDLNIQAYGEIKLTTTNHGRGLVVGESIEMDAQRVYINDDLVIGDRTELSTPEGNFVAQISGGGVDIRNTSFIVDTNGALWSLGSKSSDTAYVQGSNGDISLVGVQGVTISDGGNGSDLQINTASYLVINTANGTNIETGDLNVVDGFCYANAFFETSDENLKDFSGDIDVDFAKLKEIRKSYFTWKDGDGKMQIGTSAQDVQKVYPELVSETKDGKLTVDYAKLSIIALSAIDKLDERLSKIEKALNITE